MARPSKLTEKQWAEIEKRIPPAGSESIRSVAKEHRISEGVIRKRVKTHTKPLNQLANQMAIAEMAFDKLPINAQVKVRTLADRLKGISENLASAAEYGSMTAHRLKQIAHAQLGKINETNPMDSHDVMVTMGALTKLANSSSEIGLNLLSANKDFMKDVNSGEATDPAETLKEISKLLPN